MDSLKSVLLQSEQGQNGADNEVALSPAVFSWNVEPNSQNNGEVPRHDRLTAYMNHQSIILKQLSSTVTLLQVRIPRRHGLSSPTNGE